MYASALLPLLPLLPLALAAPRRYPLPYLLRRDALDLPPALTAAYTASSTEVYQSTAGATGAPTGVPSDSSNSQGIWQVDTIPLSLVASAPMSDSPTQAATAGYTASSTAGWVVAPTGAPTALDEGSLALPSDNVITGDSAVTATSTTTVADWSLPTIKPTSPPSTSSALVSPTSSAVAWSSTSSSSAASKAAAAGASPSSSSESKKIRFKHCAETGGTVTDIAISPCEGGKGTINDPCHFHAGNNYTITLNYVSPTNASQPRSNVVARDRGITKGSEYFPYPGQAFDACQYTSCPLAADDAATFTYEFVTLDTRFDQLTFNMTDGVEGDSLMCAHFPVTFMPSHDD